MNNVVKNGLILGGINILFLFGIYIIDISMITSWKVIGVSFVVSIALNVFFALQLRKDAGGFMLFKQAFVSIFVMLAISSVLTLSSKVLLYNVIDTSIPEQIKQASIEQIESMFEAMGVNDQEVINAAMQQVDSEAFSMNMLNTGSELFSNLGLAAFFGLFIALFVKKDPPINYMREGDSDDEQYDDI